MKKMIRQLLLASFLMMATSLSLGGEKSNLHWMSFDEAVGEAKKTDKKILIDVYTDWCGWCKRMDSQTYSNKDVESYLSQKYVLVKLNAESSRKLHYNGAQYTEQELAGAFGISGYPSTIFLKSTSEAITVLPGFADAPQFRDILVYIAEDQYLTTKFQDYLATKHR
jgi:thioredoxin-related protein